MENIQTSSPPPEIPDGMEEVSKAEFFALLAVDGRDIMPKLTSPRHTTWETTDRLVWGWSYPGWRGPDAPRVFAVLRGVRPKNTR